MDLSISTLRGFLKRDNNTKKVTHPLDLDELAGVDRKHSMYSASDESEKEVVVDTDMEALVPSCADHTFVVGEVMDVVVAYAVDIGPMVKSYLNRTVIKFCRRKIMKIYIYIALASVDLVVAYL